MFAHHSGVTCALTTGVIAYCRYPVPSGAASVDAPPVTALCSQCRIELVRLQLLPTSCDPRPWAYPQRPTRDMRVRRVDVAEIEEVA